MRTLGMIGGMGWESTIEYYKRINQEVNKQLKGWNSAQLILYSVNFDEIIHLQQEGKWEEIAVIMIDIARTLERLGAEGIFICSNTTHRVADEIEASITVPIINVIDEVARSIEKMKLKKVGLLGTQFTMEGNFYPYRLKEKWDIETIIPSIQDREFINKSIYEEFVKGIFTKETKQKYLDIIERLSSQGAEGIILGCTEIPLLINKKDTNIPLFDSMELHVMGAINFILK